MRRALPVLLALASAVVAFAFALIFERGLINLLGLDLRELEWISDVVLAVAFGAATFLWLHLRLARTALTRLERAQVAFETELAVAADIQRGLLSPPPPARKGWAFAARLEHAGYVGGDFYDFIDRGRSLFVLLADVSGKGIPAALVTASSRALFRQISRETDDPAELLTQLGGALWEDHGGKPYLTAFVAHFDLDARSLSWANAGHPSGLLVRGGERLALAATGPPAGLFPEATYRSQLLRLTAGDVVVLVTDGVTEAIEADGDVEEQLAETVALSRKKGAVAVCDSVMRLARSGRGPKGVGAWQDDRTVVAVTLDEA
jgi:sigma-B regulation protein RsbU (phosphoserine phosphatase)